MEMMDSVDLTLVLKMKEIVILMMSVMMVFFVDTTTAQLILNFTLMWIAVVIPKLRAQIFLIHTQYRIQK